MYPSVSRALRSQQTHSTFTVPQLPTNPTPLWTPPPPIPAHPWRALSVAGQGSRHRRRYPFATARNLLPAAEMNAVCRQQGTHFIAVESRGVFGYVFVDFGDQFHVVDVDGTEPARHVITDITTSEAAEVTVDEVLCAVPDSPFPSTQGSAERPVQPQTPNAVKGQTWELGSLEMWQRFAKGGSDPQRDRFLFLGGRGGSQSKVAVDNDWCLLPLTTRSHAASTDLLAKGAQGRVFGPCQVFLSLWWPPACAACCADSVTNTTHVIVYTSTGEGPNCQKAGCRAHNDIHIFY